jgi:hypothetical protein
MFKISGGLSPAGICLQKIHIDPHLAERRPWILRFPDTQEAEACKSYLQLILEIRKGIIIEAST